MPRLSYSRACWDTWEAELSETIRHLQVGDFRILEFGGHYVQVRMNAGTEIVAECEGPVSVGATGYYTSDQLSRIASLGWFPPDLRSGWSNFRIHWRSDRFGGRLSALPDSRDARDAACLLVRTVRDVFGASHPSEVVVS